MPDPTVFISSTFEDLKSHREAAQRAAVRCGFAVRMMETFTAANAPPLDECWAKVDQADVLVTIIAHRYGWEPAGQQGASDERKSITWLECERALAAQKDVLAFLVDEEYDWPAQRREEHRIATATVDGSITQKLIKEVQRNLRRLKALKAWIGEGRVYRKFTTPESLAVEVEAALRDWRAAHPHVLASPGTPSVQAACDPSQYLAWLDEETGYINIRGLQVGSGQANRFPIDQLYIPLTTTVAGDREMLAGKGKRREGAAEEGDLRSDVSARSGDLRRARSDVSARSGDLRRAQGRKHQPGSDVEPCHVRLHEALRSRRLVIIGDPGAGKSTFLQRITNLLCRARRDAAQADLPQQRLGLAGQPLPVLIRVWDLVEHCQNARKKSDGPTKPDSPDWLLHYLDTQCREQRQGLDRQYFQQLLDRGDVVVLLDGLDEAPTEETREQVARLVSAAAKAYAKCRFVVTSRPAAYEREAVLDGFDQVQIDRLDDDAIAGFLGRWYEALFPESARQAVVHRDQLLAALRERPEIHRLARNPVMLTALGVVHWNERRLPEQRADLYESIITWLSRSRKSRPGRPAPETAVNLLQELALAMQTHPAGRQIQVNRHWAAEQIAREQLRNLLPAGAGAPPSEQELARELARQTAWAEAFLRLEEIDSGIVVRRGDEIRFWHLTFQEFLGARAAASRTDVQQRELLATRAPKTQALRIYDPTWREMVLLLAGVLYHQGHRRVDEMFAAVIDQLPDHADLADQARCAALLGAAVQDLRRFSTSAAGAVSPETPSESYQPGDPRYQQILDEVFGIFDPQQSERVPIKVAIQAADALGQAGDPRFSGARRDDNWISIPEGEFLMGSQKTDPHAPNYDPAANDDELPAHTVWLDAFCMAKYPVTVAEYGRFVEDDGYKNEAHWKAGGFGKGERPDAWDDQLVHPNRPVVNVTWFEAAAYAAWCGCRLPSEAQWERAARGTAGRRYPWGNDDADPRRMYYWTSDEKDRLGHPTPVGLYPRGATPEGIQELAGNVWEWCWDWYAGYASGKERNSSGPGAGSPRVLRGGSWLNYASNCRCAYRYCLPPGSRSRNYGFRLVS